MDEYGISYWEKNQINLEKPCDLGGIYIEGKVND
jgi:hypothetical protein